MNDSPTQMVFHLRGTRVRRVRPARCVVPRGKPLPRTLVVPPGVYAIAGRTYSLEQEGLYRALDPGRANRQRIVFRKDVVALVSGLCWMHSHGSRDDRKSFAALRRQAVTDKLIMTCGPFCDFVVQLLDRIGVRCRGVAMRTLRAHNGWNDGHVTLEVWTGKRWVLLDADQHMVCRHKGRRLSLLDLVPRVRAGDYEAVPLAASFPLAISGFRGLDNGYDYGMLVETREGGQSRERVYREALRRLLGVPCIADGEHRFFTTLNEAERRMAMKRLREEPSWRGMVYLPPGEFRTRFYDDLATTGPAPVGP